MNLTGRKINVLDSLIRSVKAGSAQAFEELVRKHEGRIRAYCSLLLSSRSLGEDAAQEVFLKVYRQIDKLRDEGKFEQWLLALARNHCFDELRRRKASPEIANSSSLPETLAEVVVSTFNNEQGRVESFDLLNRLLSSLPANYREILLLKELYGFSYEELAKILQLTVEGVRGQLKRARAASEERVRELMEIRGGGDEELPRKSEIKD